MITSENYFSPENQLKYMSASQYKAFTECEAMALAEIKGEYIREKITSLLVGSYVDAYFEDNLDKFKLENADVFTQKGTLRAEFKHAEYIIQRLERDTLFMKYMSGQKQVIKTGEIDGVPFKIKIDSYHPERAIVDLKIMKDFAPMWKDGLKLNFVEYWMHDYQGAIYRAIEGNNLRFFIAAATKEKEPDLTVIEIPTERLDYCLEQIKLNVKRFDSIKKGLIEPTRCGVCDYCKSTKILTEVISYESLNL